MGSVSRGRWNRGVWEALSTTNGMSSWAWLLAAVLVSLLTASVARPPLTAAKEEEATQGPEGKQSRVGGARQTHLFGAFRNNTVYKSMKALWTSDLHPSEDTIEHKNYICFFRLFT